MAKIYQHKSKENIEEENSSSFLFGFFVNYLKPSAYLTSVNEIDLDSLKEQGIKLIICDLDNTLVPHFTKFPTKEAITFVSEVKKRNIEFVIVSNNTSKRVSFFSEKLGLDDYIAAAKKPFPWALKKTIKRLGYQPYETVMVGDMLVTDTLAANLVHTESILVQPLIDPDRAWDKVLSWFERVFFKKLSKENLIVKSQTLRKNIYSEDYEVL